MVRCVNKIEKVPRNIDHLVYMAVNLEEGIKLCTGGRTIIFTYSMDLLCRKANLALHLSLFPNGLDMFRMQESLF